MRGCVNVAADCNPRALAIAVQGKYIARLRKSKPLAWRVAAPLSKPADPTHPRCPVDVPSQGGVQPGNKKTIMKIALAGDDAGIGTAVSDSSLNDQEFVKIGEMASAFGVTLRALRFYEDKGLLSPHREGTMRLYTRRDRGRLKLILLGRKIGFSLRDVKQLIDLYDPSGSNAKQLRTALEKSEKQLGRLQKQRAALDEAIADVKDLMVTVRKMLSERTVATSNDNSR